MTGRFRRAAAVAVGAVIATMASSIVPGTRIEVQDWDCPPAPASCARTVVAAGFPVPYIADYHGISPVGSADLVQALMGIDKLRAGAFLTNVGFYALMLATILAVTTRRMNASRASVREA